MAKGIDLIEGDERTRSLGIDPAAHGSTVTWRYIDEKKFDSLFSSKRIYFRRLDLQQDQYEGAIPQPTLEDRLKYSAFNHYKDSSDENERFVYKLHKQQALNNVEARSWRIYVNCWHESPHESALMWKNYCGAGNAVAIRSSVARLRAALPTNSKIDGGPDEPHVDIGRVRYIDYSRDFIDSCYEFVPALLKRDIFRGEKEIRLIRQIKLEGTGSAGFSVSWRGSTGELVSSEEQHDPGYLWEKPTEDGLFIDCNLNHLIEAIYVSPYSSSEFAQKVSQKLETAGIDVPICLSEVFDKPIY